MNEFTHHQLKTIFTILRKRQEDCLRTYQYAEYEELNEILTILQPIAYKETYLSTESEYNKIPDRY